MIEVIDDERLLELRQLIENCTRVLICGHVSPDGDAIGSTLALCHLLRGRGKTVDVCVPTQFPDFLRWMPGADEVHVYMRHEEELKPVIAAADLVLIVDMNEPTRMAEMMEPVMRNEAPRVMIDHHLNPSQFCRITVSHPEMCAAGEVICHLLEQMGELATVTPEVATCLYAAMMCDTGAFTFNSNRAVVYECISRLLERGIDKDRIYRNVFWTWSPARMKLQGYLLYVKAEPMPEFHACIMTLTLQERRMLGVRGGDTDGMVNLPLQVSGTRLSVLLSEDTEHQGVIKVSLRSVDDFPCNEMSARFFEGGGHKNASGGRIHGTMEEAVELTRKAIREFGALLR